MDVMLDLETMGTTVNTAIVSVGALAFERSKKIPADINFGVSGFGFYQNVDLQSCIDLGLEIEASTVMWWLYQSHEARAALKTPPPVHVREVMVSLNAYLTRHLTPRTGCVWSHGATFDIPIVAEIMRRLKDPKTGKSMTPAWRFWNARDTRTLFDEAGVKLENARERTGGHNAFYDCVAQTSLLQDAFRIVRSRHGGAELVAAIAAEETEVAADW